MLINASVNYLDCGGRPHVRRYSIESGDLAEFYRILNEYVEDDENENSWDMTSVEVAHEKEKTAQVS
jgi:hypothetical protein